MEKNRVEASVNIQPQQATTGAEAPKATKEAKPKPPKFVDVVCVECGAVRTVGRGDVFQVKRCVECQEKHKKDLRRGYRKARLGKLKNRIQELEDKLALATK